jgi:hypothetical protein
MPQRHFRPKEVRHLVRESSENGGRLVLITGIPGSGKSRVLEELEGHGWRGLRGDDKPRGRWAEDDERAWDLFVRGDDAEIRRLAAAEPVGLAIEFGFPGGMISTVELWISRGVEAWFLDGDHQAAFQAWRAANDYPDEVFWNQLQSLVGVDVDISRIFGSRRIRTVAAGLVHAPVEATLERMGLA